MKTNEEFFDSISSFYDKMINFDSAIERRKDALKGFIDKSIHLAADAGSGTGLDSIALSLLGLDVTGFDLSKNMIEQAKLNAEVYRADIKFVQSSIDAISPEYNKTFDFAVSLGNTLANIKIEKIGIAFKSLYNILNDKGSILIQILNFNNEKLNSDRVVNITAKDEWFYIRFYDFFEKEINFNILKFNRDNPSKREMKTTTLYKYMPEELKEYMIEAGFKDIKFYENFAKKEFDNNSSKDLIITAQK